MKDQLPLPLVAFASQADTKLKTRVVARVPQWTDGGARIHNAYRYHLWRSGLFVPGALRAPLVPARRLLWLMLNPSFADGKRDDATLKRILGYTYDWYYDRLDVVNMCGLRATDPAMLLRARDPVGPDNDRTILEQFELADAVVLAWGAGGDIRSAAVVQLLYRSAARALRDDRIYALGFTAGGQPVHPLRQARALEPVRVVLGADGHVRAAVG
jgi:hypothetical protein